MSSHGLWVERYRPSALDTYVGNETLKTKVERFIEEQNVPHLLLYGRAGGGKTTLAKIIVNAIECDYLYINASDERNIDLVRDKLKNFASSVGFKPNKIVILDEADYLNVNSAQPALRNLMETFSQHCRFILTCNYVERIIDPIQSRCQSFQIIPPDRKQVAVHMSNILQSENVTSYNKDIVTLVNGGYPDIRRVINSAQRQVVDNKLVIDEAMITQNDYKLSLLEILKTQDKKNSFKNIRQLIADSKVTDFSDLFRLLFDTIDDWGRGHIAECILLLSQYQQSDAVVVDKEINIMAMFTEIIGVIK